MPWQRVDDGSSSFGKYKLVPNGSGGLPWGGRSPGGYQAQSEGFFNRAANVYDTMGSYGNTMLGDYTGRWMPRLDQMWGEQRAFSPEDYASRAAVDVNSAYDTSRGQIQRGLTRMGINPNSGRFAGLEQQWGIARAAALAGAMNRARAQGREENFLRAMRVLGLAQGGAGIGANLLGAQAGGMMNLGGQYGGIAGDAAALQAYQSERGGAPATAPAAAPGVAPAGATVADARAGGQTTGLNLAAGDRYMTPLGEAPADVRARYGIGPQPGGYTIDSFGRRRDFNFAPQSAPSKGGYFIDSSGRRHDFDPSTGGFN